MSSCVALLPACVLGFHAYIATQGIRARDISENRKLFRVVCVAIIGHFMWIFVGMLVIGPSHLLLVRHGSNRSGKIICRMRIKSKISVFRPCALCKNGDEKSAFYGAFVGRASIRIVRSTPYGVYRARGEPIPKYSIPIPYLVHVHASQLLI